MQQSKKKDKKLIITEGLYIKKTTRTFLCSANEASKTATLTTSATTTTNTIINTVTTTKKT